MNLEKLKTLKANLNNLCEKLTLSTTDGYHFVKLEDIVYCESQNNYTLFYLTCGKKILVSKTLKIFSTMLEDYHFFRVSRSHLVNLNHVIKLGRQKKPNITMSNDDRLLLSTARKEFFIQMFT